MSQRKALSSSLGGGPQGSPIQNFYRWEKDDTRYFGKAGAFGMAGGVGGGGVTIL